MRFLIGWIIMLGSIFTQNSYAMNRNVAAEKPLVVILMGPPAAGKGTQATSLSEYLGMPHISTGDLFRENIRNLTPVGKLAKTYIDQGKLVPDQVTLEMLFERVAKIDCKAGYILDGFPRTVDQAQALDRSLQSTHEIVVLNLNVPDEVLLDRIAGRLVCKGCSKPYHITSAPPQHEGVCDACGGSLYQRDDDNVATFAKRLEVYRAQTEPLIAHYQKKGLLHQIGQQDSSNQVFQEIIQALPRSPAVR